MIQHSKRWLLLFIASSQIIAFGQTTIEGNFTHDGILRNYRAYIPSIYNPATPVPLLFNLHGYGSNNIEQELYGDFRPIADTANFIIVHPNGTFSAPNIRFWNTFGGATVDDIGFLSRLIDTMRSKYNIDPNRIYSTGMSNGGFMSYDLACMLSHRIAAVASVTGSMILPRLSTCSPTHPMPVMQIHGTADATVPYNGSFLFSHIDTLVRHWVRKNNCQVVPVAIAVPDINPQDGCTAVRYIYDGGNKGSIVELYKVFGGGHSWPGAPINLNTTCMDFSASKEIWRFLRQFSLQILTTGNDKLAATDDGIQIFPNPSSGKFSVRFVNPGKRHISLLNAVSQVVYSAETTAEYVEIEPQSMGLHLLRVLHGNKVSVARIILK